MRSRREEIKRVEESIVYSIGDKTRQNKTRVKGSLKCAECLCQLFLYSIPFSQECQLFIPTHFYLCAVYIMFVILDISMDTDLSSVGRAEDCRCNRFPQVAGSTPAGRILFYIRVKDKTKQKKTKEENKRKKTYEKEYDYFFILTENIIH